MENLSHSRQHHTLPKKTCNAAAKSIYDDVFGAPPRFGAPSLSPRVEDYAEIFGSFHSSSRASSIPVLDLPLAVDGDIFFDVRTSHFDYSDVFGGFNGSDFAVSFEELVMADNRCNGLGGSSDEAWSPVEADYLSEESEPSPKSEGFFNGKSCESAVDGNDMKFNISYNKVGRSSSEDIAQFHPVPEYTFVVDKAASLLKLDDDDDYVSMRLSDDGHFNIDLSREMVIERPLKKTMSNPVNGGGKAGMLFGDDVRTCRDYVRTSSFPNETFVTISDVSLKTQPSQVPPPTRLPPALDVKKKDSKLIPNSKTCTFEGFVGDTSPPYFDVEVDANSSAAVSAAAIKEAMEKAQAKMKSAKELMERKKEGFQSRTKSGLKDNRKDREGNVGRSIDGLGSNDEIETKIAEERHYVKRTSRLVLDSLEGEKYQNGSKREETLARDSLSSQGSDKIDGASEWKEATEFFELVRTDKSKNIFDHVINESILAQRTNVIEHGRKEQNENDKKGKSASTQLEEYERKVNTSKEFSASQVNNGRLEASVAVQRQKELQKKVQRSQEASRQTENEKKLMIDRQLAEAERKQMRADDLQINEKMEVQYKEIKLEVKEPMRHKEKEPQAKEANKKSDDENRFTCEKKGTERRQREALEKLENEKKLNAALEQAKNERRLKEDMMEQAEKEKRMKEAYEREKNEKKKKKALEREENERRLREALEQEENERRLREAFEKQENERRRKETLEKEQKERRLREALEKEEDEKRQGQNLEKEENERRLRQNLEEEENERRQREAAEREENENRQREAFEREENGKRLKEALEKKEKEKRDGHSLEKEHDDRLKRAFELQGHQKKQGEACEKEEIQKGHRDDFGSVKAERIGKRTEEEIEQQKNKPLREAQVGKEAEEGQKEILYQEEFGDTSLEAHKPEDMRKNFQDADELDESNVKPTQLAGKNEGIYGILEDTEDIDRGELRNIQGGLRSNKKEAVDQNANIDRKKEPSDLCQDNLEHENASEVPSEDGSMKKAGEARHSIRPRNFASQKSSALNQGKNYTHESGENGNKIEQAQVSRTEYTKDNLSSAMAQETFETGKKVEATQPATSEAKGSTLRTAQQVNVSQAAERKMKNCDDTTSGEDRETERIKREKELEMERLRKMEEEMEREREREKDRMAVDIATLEARERAYSDTRERAERAAIERALAEARQRAMNEARERLEKACAEAREKSLTDKASVEARIRSERAAVERATAEARERAFEKAMAERAASEARERLERSVSDKFSASSRNTGVRLNSLSSGLQDMQTQNSGSSNGSRYQYSSVYGGSCNMERSNGVEGESPQRCKARLERHRRTAERAAKALAEKNMRDLLAQREQAERNRIAETLDAEVRRWSSGKEGNLRALLSTLQYILGPDSGWHPVPLTEVITSAAVKKAYRKATLCVHPDKLQQRGASIHQKYICEKVFDLLKEAWYKFNSEER